MRQIVPIAFVVMLAATAPHLGMVLAAASSAPIAAGAIALAKVTAGTVKVTVNYKGKGTVDGSHRVWVWLFDTPDIQPGAMPIAQMFVDKNGAVATFDGVTAKQVWVVCAFDEQGAMDGNGPPPSGTPVGIFMGPEGMPKSVIPGDTASAVVTFDDSFRMP